MVATKRIHRSRQLFNGALPSSYGNWSSITLFDVSANSLAGTLPLEYSLLTDLSTFGISNNTISGTIPMQYAAWKSIGRLRLDTNALVGTIPNSLFHLNFVAPKFADWHCSVSIVSIADAASSLSLLEYA